MKKNLLSDCVLDVKPVHIKKIGVRVAGVKVKCKSNLH